jgi:hypothetical protein
MAFTVAELRDMPNARPMYLVEIQTLNSGDMLYLSDRNRVFSSQNYEAYLQDLSNVGAELERADSSGLNAEVSFQFLNDGYKTDGYLSDYLDTYPLEGAAVTVKEIYIDVNDTNSSDSVTIFTGIMDAPKVINQQSFVCSASDKGVYKQQDGVRGRF